MLKKINSFLILLTALLCFGAANAWGEKITVADGTTANQYHPIYGYYCDDASHHNQVLYTVSEFADLADMAGAQITKMKFYSSNASSSWGSLKVNIKLAEVSESALSGFNTTSALTSVYSGPISVSGTEMVIEFTDPFDYNGGNLLFDLTISAIGSYQQIKFYGVGTYDYIYSYKKDGDGSKSSYFVPKTTFTYEAPSSCAKPTDLTKGTITANSASFSWTAGGSESEWQYLCLPAVEEPDWSSASVKSTTASTVIVDGLEASTGYKFYVRANCGGTDGVSSVVSVAFKTACGAISTLPKTWNFDGIDDNAFPDCWQYITTSSTTPRVYNYGYYANSSPKSLYVYGGSASTPTTIIFHFPSF